MKSRLLVLSQVLGGLVLTGAVMRRVEAPLWAALQAERPALRAAAMEAAAGQGMALGVLGGFRAIAADFAWIRVYVIWEKHDLPGTETLLRLVTTLDPRPLYFWLNGARIIAYDMTAWRIAAAGGYDAVPVAEQEQIGARQAHLALGWLDEAMVQHPASADLWIDRANIELNGRHDAAAAAESYRHAWEQPHAPYYAARLYGELLRRLGRRTEALQWLVKLYPQLPADDDSAGAPLVLARIRDLERELRVSPAGAYRPAR